MYANESEAPKYTSEEFQAVTRAWQAVGMETKNAGVLVSSSGLAPVADATTVRVQNGRPPR